MEQFNTAQRRRAGVGSADDNCVEQAVLDRQDEGRVNRERPDGLDGEPGTGIVGDCRSQVVVTTRAVLLPR
jgi:hypothetical protein